MSKLHKTIQISMNTEYKIKVKTTYSIKKYFRKMNKCFTFKISLCIRIHNDRMTWTWTTHTIEQYHPSCTSRPIKHTPVRVLCNNNRLLVFVRTKNCSRRITTLPQLLPSLCRFGYSDNNILMCNDLDGGKTSSYDINICLRKYVLSPWSSNDFIIYWHQNV